jgi:hypothetical protein
MTDTTTTMPSLADTLLDPMARQAARLIVTELKKRVKADMALLVELADALVEPTHSVAVDDLHELVADLGNTLPPKPAPHLFSVESNAPVTPWVSDHLLAA